MSKMDEVTIYCDGACSGNPGPSGWGAVLIFKGVAKEFSGYCGIGTNNSAELNAAIEAIKCLKRPCKVTLYSDSKYLIEGAKGNWSIKTNHDFWEELFMQVHAGGHEINWQWVKGHNGNAYNEHANVLANRRANRGS